MKHRVRVRPCLALLVRIARVGAMLLAATFIVFAPASGAAESIRVVIADNQKRVVLRSGGGLEAEGARVAAAPKELIATTANVNGRPLRVRPRGGDLLSMNGAEYRGAIEVRKKRNGSLLVVNELDIEDYLLGVVAAEVPADWEEEALKAQAVASRTYALHEKRVARGRAYHLTATVAGQMYLGRRGERGRATRAVRETADLVLQFRGELIPAFYHSSCGGHTEDALELWGIDAPYLKGVDCDCQEISAYGLWEKRMSIASVLLALGREGYRPGAVGGIEIGALTSAGRVKTVRLRSAAGAVTLVPAETLRAALGYSRIPSVFFEPELIEGEFVFSGRGLGHGVGLCQWGAKDLARKGRDFRQILRHYYPGTEIAAFGSLYAQGPAR